MKTTFVFLLFVSTVLAVLGSVSFARADQVCDRHANILHRIRDLFSCETDFYNVVASSYRELSTISLSGKWFFDGRFDVTGTNSKYYSNSKVPAFGPGKKLTVTLSLFMTQGPTGKWRNLFHKGASNNNWGRGPAVWLSPNNMKLHFCMDSTKVNDYFYSTQALTLNNWNHLSFVVDGTQTLIYINGKLDGKHTLQGLARPNTGPLYIGDDPWFSGVVGSIKHFRVFPDALDSCSVEEVARQANPPTEFIQTSRSFTGTNKVTIPQVGVPRFGSGKTLTVTTWAFISRGPTGVWRNLFHKGATNNDWGRGPAMWLFPNTMKLHCSIDSTVKNDYLNSNVVLSVNRWYHLAFVVDGTTTRLWIDGKLDKSHSLKGAARFNTGPLYIGDDPWHSGITGNLKHFRVYPQALDGSEINKDMNL